MGMRWKFFHDESKRVYVFMMNQRECVERKRIDGRDECRKNLYKNVREKKYMFLID